MSSELRFIAVRDTQQNQSREKAHRAKLEEMRKKPARILSQAGHMGTQCLKFQVPERKASI